MTKKLLLAALTISLGVTGCSQQQKKINTTGNGLSTTNGSYTGTTTTGLNTGVINSSNGTTTGLGTTTGYENVDPYGNGYGQTANSGYSEGTDYSTNSEYSVNNGYGHSVSTGVQNIYFAPDQYTIAADKIGIISQNAKYLKKHSKIKIEGHCDASGTDEYNYALGLRRAQSAKEALINNGIRPSQISLVSMGESSPECTTSSSASCYAKNRRVEFKAIK